MYTYRFNISGDFGRMGSAMSVFLDKKESLLTRDIEFTVDSVVWGNEPEPSVDQAAELYVSFKEPLTEKRLLDFKDEFYGMAISISGV